MGVGYSDLAQVHKELLEKTNREIVNLQHPLHRTKMTYTAIGIVPAAIASGIFYPLADWIFSENSSTPGMLSGALGGAVICCFYALGKHKATQEELPLREQKIRLEDKIQNYTRLDKQETERILKNTKQ